MLNRFIVDIRKIRHNRNPDCEQKPEDDSDYPLHKSGCSSHHFFAGCSFEGGKETYSSSEDTSSAGGFSD